MDNNSRGDLTRPRDGPAFGTVKRLRKKMYVELDTVC